MILIVTNRADLTADWLILELHERRLPFRRFNTEDFPYPQGVRWQPGGASGLSDGGRYLDLNRVSSVWYRRPLPPARRNDVTHDESEWAAGEAAEALAGVWRTMNCLWVNRPEANRLAENKLEQLQRALTLGLEIPQTLVTGDVFVAREFLRECEGRLICKPMRNGRPIVDGSERIFFTSLVREIDDSFGPEPYLLQSLVEKAADIRVTVIDQEVFAVRIESQVSDGGRIDWRKSGDLPRHVPVLLPDDVAQACLTLTKSYELKFAAIDLAVTEEGRYVFFEVNPNGQWVWLEQLTGLPLRAHLVKLLAEG